MINFTWNNRNSGINNVDKLIKKISNDVYMAFLESAFKIQSDAKNTIIVNNHVITGNLRDSITGEVKTTKKYKVRTNFKLKAYSRVFYAIYVERLDPYLFPAVEKEKRILENKLKKILGR